MTSTKFSSIEEIKKALERLKDEEDLNYEYVIIYRRLISSEFTNNNSPAIKIETAICICKLLSQLNVDSFYEDLIVEETFNFLIKELKNLNKESEYYSQYLDLLKTIEETKVFVLGIRLSSEEGREKIFKNLFQVIFDLVNENEENNLKSLMLSVLVSIIEQATNLPFFILNNLFQNVIEPQKSFRKKVYEFTIKLIQETKNDFKTFFFNFVNIVKREGDTAVEIFSLYDVSYELRNIFPKVIYDTILPYAKFKIKSLEDKIRTSSVIFLGKMFSDPASRLAISQPELFSMFLGRIHDINVDIRLLLIKFFEIIILKHPEVRNKTSERMRLAQVDPEPKVRMEGVSLMSQAIFKNITILEGNEHLKSFLQGVKSDPEFSVRELELVTMSIAFKEHVGNCMKLSPELRNALLRVQTRILFAYSENKDVADTILIEKLFRKNLVSCDLPTDRRMKRLFHFYSTLHVWVLRSFSELQESEYLNRKLLAKWIELIKVPESRSKIREEFRIMTKYKKGPMGSMEFVEAFESRLMGNPSLVAQLEKIVASHVSCEEGIIAFNIAQAILSESDEPFYEEVLTVIERGTSFIVDDESVWVLIDYVFEALEDSSIIKDLDLDPINAGDRGLKLLRVLAKYFPTSFEFEDILERFINYLETEDRIRKTLMISLLVTLGKQKPLYEIIKSESTLQLLISTCKELAIEGNPKESKESIRCLKIATPNFDLVYEEILEIMDSTLKPNSDYFLGSIVALGHVAIERSEGKCEEVENLMPRIIEYLRKREDSGTERTHPEIDWCSEDQLSMKERSYEEAIKSVGRWICELKTEFQILHSLAKDFFCLANHHVVEPYSSNEPTKNRLRAKVACTILKICEREELRHSLPPQNFYNLSKLMNDESMNVTKMFIRKLAKGLKTNLPKRFLTNEFLGFFILAGKQDTELLNEINFAFESIINKRNFFVDYMMKTAGNNVSKNPLLKERLFEWLPEFSIVYALPILARDPDFKNFEDVNLAEMRKLERYLWNFLQPLVENSNFNCFDLFKNIGEKLKQFGDTHSSDLNTKLWTLNELLLTIVNKRLKRTAAKLLEVEIKIPRSHYIEIVDIHQYYDYDYWPSAMRRKANKSRKKKLVTDSTRKRGKRAKRS